MTEKLLHDQFAAWLRKEHIPFSHDRMDKETSNTVGDPDFRCYKNDRVAMIEFKMLGKKMRPEQQARADELASAGCTVRLCYDLQSAIDWVEEVFSDSVPRHATKIKTETAKVRPNEFLAYERNLSGETKVSVVARNPSGHFGFVRWATEADKERLERK